MRIGMYGLLAVALLAIGGCGKPDTIVTGANGEKATISQDGKNMTVTDGKGGSATLGTTVSEADLGVPFYPSSAEKASGSMAMDQGGEKTVSSARTTKDEPTAVTAFYKDKITDGKPSDMNSGDTKMATIGGKLKDGAEVSVIATKKGSEDTDIVVVVKRKK